ncbi:MAG TPA: ATPase, partial [Thermofilum sp.]|nr:ATPase [Thermofilum sp.]
MRKIVRKARVLKASGEIESYSRDKLISSLTKAGLNEDKAEILVSMLEKEMPDFVSSNHIHERVYELLKIHYPKYALKYALKRAIMRLGPEG